MRYGVALAALLPALLVACNPYVKPIAEDSGAELSVPDLAARAPQMVALTSMVMDIPAGTHVGQMSAGWSNSCARHEPIVIKRGTSKIDVGIYQPVFKEVLDLAGIPVQQTIQRFEGEQFQKADLQIAGTLKEMALNLCYPEVGNDESHARGKAQATFEWSVFSPIERTIVYTTTTRGATPGEVDSRMGEGGVVREAFRTALIQLVNLKEFQDVVVRKSAAGAARAPAAAQDSLALAQPARRQGFLTTQLDSLRSSVVTVRSNTGEGSGFAVGGGEYVVTSAHVVAGSTYVKLLELSGAEHYGEVVRLHAARDLALIKLAQSRLTPLHIRPDLVAAGTEVYAIGSPLGNELAFSVTKGIVSGIRQHESQDYIQCDLTILPGNSGGPLLDASGNVVGIALSGVAFQGTPVGVNFFAPSRDLFASVLLRNPEAGSSLRK